MANAYFQFKQFRIEQDCCAMKVCTDSCLFGAYIPVESATNILDIGTGTGLLALMAAQRSAGHIQAVELDETAVRQATENFAASPWTNRISLFAGSLQVFEQVNTQVYDLIFSNPPFFQASQKSPDMARNRARHTIDLPFTDLIRFVQKFLTATGSLYILLPPAEARLITELAHSCHLYLHQNCPVFTREAGKHIRSMLHFQKLPAPAPEPINAICIRQSVNQYTGTFRKLLEPYYQIF